MTRVNHLKVTAAYWNGEAPHYASSHPEHRQMQLHPSWGLWHIPEAQLRLVLDEMKPDCRIVELGCGPGHDAVGFAELGATVLAVDISQEQLRHAVPHPRVTYLLGPAERLPVADESMDFAISDHGAFNYAPTPGLLREVCRVLRPGGLLVVCTPSPLSFVCFDPRTGTLARELVNDYPANRILFDGSSIGVERSYAEWVRVFREHHLTIERLEELLPDASSPGYFGELCDPGWGSRWPSDIVWVVRKGTPPYSPERASPAVDGGGG